MLEEMVCEAGAALLGPGSEGGPVPALMRLDDQFASVRILLLPLNAEKCLRSRN